MPPTKNNSIPQSIYSLLAKLRRKVRGYVVIEAAALLIVWLVVTFWCALVVDYLPVTFGLDELSQVARTVVLTTILVSAIWILWHFLLRRIFVSLPDSSMALLLERTFPEFNECLITTVESVTAKKPDSGQIEMANPEGDDPTGDVIYDAAMRERTVTRAQSIARHVDPSRAINYGPLKKRIAIACGLAMTVLVLALQKPAVFLLATERIYALGEEKWPHRNQLEMIGIKVQRENTIEGIVATGEVTKPDEQNRFLVGRGSSLTLMIRARVSQTAGKRTAEGSIGDTTRSDSTLPDSCTLHYRDADGNQGRQTLKRVGVSRDGYQLYSLDEAPLAGLLNDIEFTIRGGDHRIGPFKIAVTDWPAVISTGLECSFPSYMVDEKSMRWTPRTIAWTGRAQLPRGTSVIVRCKTNKPLSRVYVVSAGQSSSNVKIASPDTGNEALSETTVQEIRATENEFEFALSPVSSTTRVKFYLCDADGIVSEEPHTIAIEPIDDQPPNVRTMLTGIGTAVTPDVAIPVSGTITDDYGIARQWMEIETPSTGMLTEAIDTNGGQVAQSIDFRQRRQQSGYDLPTDVDSRLRITVVAVDAFDLPDADGNRSKPNQGAGDEYVLDVVSSGDLLRILERVEVGQRRRLEQIYNEMMDARNYLGRARSQLETSNETAEPGDRRDTNPDETIEDETVRDDELRWLFARRAIMQIDKSTQEITGVADAFDNIRLQLINNRVDSEDRKIRLQEQIVGPLELIALRSMRQLRESVVRLEESLKQMQAMPGEIDLSGACDVRVVTAIESATEVLAEIESVLGILVKYETQNELLDIVRQLIKQQEDLAERTARERRRAAFDGLLDE